MSGSSPSGSRAGRQVVMCSCRRSMNRAPSPLPSGCRMFPGAWGRMLPGAGGRLSGSVIGSSSQASMMAGIAGLSRCRQGSVAARGSVSGRRRWCTGSRRTGAPGASRAIQVFLTFAQLPAMRDRWALKHRMRSPVPGLVTSRAVIRAMAWAVPEGLVMRSPGSHASRLPSVSSRSVSGSRPSMRQARPGEVLHDLPGSDAEDPVGRVGRGTGAEADVVGEQAGGLGRGQQRGEGAGGAGQRGCGVPRRRRRSRAGSRTGGW